MNEDGRQRTQAAPQERDERYLHLSTRPLHILAFLAPLIVLYELGSALYLTSDESTVKLISAQVMLLRLFSVFGLR